MGNVEWSATLFYTTEGEFGEPGFKMTAQELFLQDIGSAAYTEYDPCNPDYIKYMMSNPHLMEMKIGHLHSHVDFGVFFSPVDTEEINENSAMHNFYLSLIVNNANDMCAKVAFRATCVTQPSITFKDGNGNDKTKQLARSTEEIVYVYNCDITKPQSAEEELAERFRQVKATKAATAKIHTSYPKQHVSYYNSDKGPDKEKAYGGFNVDSKWREAFKDKDDWHEGDLFEGTAYGPKKPTQIYEEKGMMGIVGGGEKWLDDKSNVSKGRIINFLVKLLNLDYVAEGSLDKTLQKLDLQFYPLEGPYNTREAREFYDYVEKGTLYYYQDSFPEDLHYLRFNKTMEEAVDLLEEKEELYPELVNQLCEILNITVDHGNS